MKKLLYLLSLFAIVTPVMAQWWQLAEPFLGRATLREPYHLVNPVILGTYTPRIQNGVEHAIWNYQRLQVNRPIAHPQIIYEYPRTVIPQEVPQPKTAVPQQLRMNELLMHKIPELTRTIDLSYIDYYSLRPFLENRYINVRGIPKVFFSDDFNRVSLTIPRSDEDALYKIIDEISTERQSPNEENGSDSCPITEPEEIAWIAKLLNKYNVEYKLSKFRVNKDLMTVAPSNSFIAIENNPFLLYVPATIGLKDLPPIVYSTDYGVKKGGIVALLKLLCSIKTKNIPHGDLYIAISSDMHKPLSAFNKIDGVSVVISFRQQLSAIPHDIALSYWKEDPYSILEVEHQCEKIILSNIDSIHVSVMPAIPFQSNSSADSLMVRVENYLAGSTLIGLKKKLTDDIGKLQRDVDFQQLSNGDLLLHLPSIKNDNCDKIKKVVFLSSIGYCVNTINNPEQHINLKMKRFGIIKSDGEGCLGLSSRVGAAFAMELLRLIDLDTSLSVEFYILLSNSFGVVETDIRLLLEETGTVYVYNDGLHRIKDNPNITVISRDYSNEVKHENTKYESLHVNRAYRSLSAIFSEIKKLSK